MRIRPHCTCLRTLFGILGVAVSLGSGCSETRGFDGASSGSSGGATRGGAPPDGSTGDGSDGSGGADSGVSGDSQGTGDSGASDGSSGPDGVRFDVGGPGDTGDRPGEGGDGKQGCAKVDFLFVVDSSGSMGDEQAKLVQNFPAFIQTIRETLTAMDYQILVVDTDAAAVNGTSRTCSGNGCTCDPRPGCCKTLCDNGQTTVCNGDPCSMLPPIPCDIALGGGKRTGAAGQDCGIEGPQRYLLDTQTDLEGTFSCLATVGTMGSGDEQTMGAATEAVTTLAAPGECNEGFVRDDAILVVTFMTDEDDGSFIGGGSPGDAAQWKQKLVGAKRGNENAIVVVGFMGETPGVPCTNGDADPAPRLREFVDLFGPRGLAGSVCATDYKPTFDAAVSLIDNACDEFIPPG